MLRCRDIPDLLADPATSLRSRWAMSVHLLICHPCRQLRRQYQQLSRSLQRLWSRSSADDEELKRKVREAILKH